MVMDGFAVGLRDLDFDHTFVRVRAECGKIQHRWIRIGMPRISRHLEKCAFYLFRLNPDYVFGLSPETDKIVGPGATGFFVARPSETLFGLYHVYAVSNRHAINPNSIIRINRKAGGIRSIEFDPADWIFSDKDDLAIVDVTVHLEISMKTTIYWHDDISWVEEKDFLTPDFISANDVGIGDQTIMVGLFADHGGGALNLPVGRFGTLASMPCTSAPVSLFDKDPFARPAYLNDTHSRTGFSGSPVWVWRTPNDDMNSFESNGFWVERRSTRSAFLRLVGVHRGQFREKTRILASESARVIKSGDDIEIASAMTVVIPTWEISKTIDNDNLKMQRDTRDKRDDRTIMSEQVSKIFRTRE
jgi:hypothetical protein